MCCLCTFASVTKHSCVYLFISIVRNPYVDCLNVLQAETLKRLRESEGSAEEDILKDALLTTITGVANGMGNTG
jgi:phosphoenolpyruvate carboxylase